MELKAGLFLKSTDPSDPVFGTATIFLTEYNAAGAVGFMIDKPFGRSLNELEEFRHSPHFPLYAGGPVDTGHLFFLHRRPDLVDGATLVDRDIYWSGNFKSALTGINNRSLTGKDIKIFVGYCGWDAGDLEAEIAEGGWQVVDAGIESIFS
jgi:putative transcriptional regulator